ncbi:MAG: sulfur carrier protein ThiS [Gammaproteobacteria bacterium]|nr:sulfur carrier protein ThiS [Gammaproteobacteria bacterium]
MNIVLNGKQQSVADQCTISDLISQLGLADKRLAVEVNLDIIPRSEHPQHQLSADDKVEIVHAIGGGCKLHGDANID